MSNPPKPQKPKSVLYAEWALWVWTAWICLSGIYETWNGVSNLGKEITDQLQSLVGLDSGAILAAVVAGYGVLAVASAWVVLKIGEGKKWARASLLWGFILQAVGTLFDPHPELLDYLKDVPDLGLQIYALYLLYTPPGRAWFPAD